MSEKKRIAIAKDKSMTMRIEFDFLSEEAFESSLNEFAKTINISTNNIIVYTLGDRDEMEEGNVYFCPRCGEYNEDGYEPNVSMYYQQNKDTQELKPAGFHKHVVVDCNTCKDAFDINTNKFDEESKELSKTLKGD